MFHNDKRLRAMLKYCPVHAANDCPDVHCTFILFDISNPGPNLYNQKETKYNLVFPIKYKQQNVRPAHLIDNIPSLPPKSVPEEIKWEEEGEVSSVTPSLQPHLRVPGAAGRTREEGA